ncbi:hypothetical protein CONPUDRAFT_162153 [Coniophora puteana RWD-64-598 SS2]|uniref:Uncharacterized protein n=1 Tax=Coniophora puteana (strain RWD-64-598) TaxID=741705 RepID=A0A5M3N0B6_CONPW|nr:uncharacterized protein CONPUDRAFT_162153 [Coniophora puteana RWD-64-598 SS2]EIW84829.1 hypothetical protein CONPUDRAFT_162153 [Coniophora puteana RWD-64-598 SS2]
MASAGQRVPVLSVPPEILTRIFEETVEQAHAQDGQGGWPYHPCQQQCIMDWIPITRVCSQWRTIAIAHKRLWSHILFFDVEYAKLMLARAGSVPLTVTLYLDHTRFDYDDLRNLSNLLKQNLHRVKDLHLEGPNRDPGEDLTRQFRENLQQGDSLGNRVKLQTLTLVLSGSWRRALANPHSIKKLFMKLANPTLEKREDALLFEGMDQLEELVIERSFSMADGIKGRKIYLPQLSRLHLDDGMMSCLEFLTELQKPRPLLYFGLKTGSCDVKSDLPSLNRLVKLSTPSGEVNLNNLSGHHCALRVGTPAEHRFSRGGTRFSLTAWRKETATASQVVGFAHQDKIPPLPDIFTFEDDEDSDDYGGYGLPPNRNGMPWFRSTDPALYLAGDLRGGVGSRVSHRVDGLMLLSKAFMLRNVVFADVNATFGEEDAVPEEGLLAFLQAMPSLQVLQLRGLSPRHFLTLMPRDVSKSRIVPVPELRELWIIDTSFFPDEDDYDSESDQQTDSDESQDTLADCLAARAALGSRLEKLVLEDCEDMQRQEWASLHELGISIEVFGNYPVCQDLDDV